MTIHKTNGKLVAVLKLTGGKKQFEMLTEEMIEMENIVEYL